MGGGTLGHRPALDGLRGIAIAVVVLGHLGIVRGNWYGVDLFFVLSGYLITTLLLEEHERHGGIDLRGFYARRVRRLLPALIALLAILGVIAIVATEAGRMSVADLKASFFTGILALIFSTNFVTDELTFHPASALGQLWSLAEEEQFYLLWPMILILLLRGNRKVAIVTLTALLTLAEWRFLSMELTDRHFGRVYFWPDTHAAPLVAGCLIAFLPAHRVARWLALPALFLFAYAVLSVHDGVGVGPYLEWTPVVTACCAVMVVAAVSGGAFARALAWKPLAGLGLISYSLYLWHGPFVFHLLPHDKPLALVCSLAAAVLSYRFIEKPFRRRRGGQLPAPQPAAASV
jgi:peptidoglycan/LPS O-acetylase OafA/YrhL